MEQKETFLDRSTLLALALLFLCWLGWQSYMGKKYSSSKKKPLEQERVFEEEKNEALPVRKPRQAERLLSFQGKEWDFTLSSHGMGFKSLKLRSFLNRSGAAVSFSSEPNKPLFALGVKGRILPFKIKRNGNRFIGRYQDGTLDVERILEVDEKTFVFKNTVHLKKHPPSFSGLRLFLYSPELKEKDRGSWYEKILFLAGKENLSGFTSSEKGTDWFLGEELKKRAMHKNRLRFLLWAGSILDMHF